MFGRLLEQVDPDRDAVMVVGPSEGRRKLTVTALRTPGSSPGYIRTASSQHDGVAIAVDVGPTLLDLFGIDFTDKMEGRPYEIVPSNASLAARSDQFIEEAQGSARRGERLAPMTAILVGLIAIVALATVLVVAVGESVSPRRRKGLAWVALFSLATLPSTLLVQLIPGGIAGFGVYLLVVGASAAVIATAAWYLPRPYGPMIGMLAFMLGVILVDAMTGSHMHYNAVFGYSPTANSRLYGISNYSFGVVLTSTILLATFIIVFARTRFAFALAMALMGFVLVVEGLPAWGSDVGGVLAGVPTFLLFALLVRQRRIRVRTLVLAVARDRGRDRGVRGHRSHAPGDRTCASRTARGAGQRGRIRTRCSRSCNGSSRPRCGSRRARSSRSRYRSASRSSSPSTGWAGSPLRSCASASRC